MTAPVTAALTNDVVIAPNEAVDVDGKDPCAVARDWMVAAGFVSKTD